MEEKKLEFYGGDWLSFLPVIAFIVVAIYVALNMGNNVTIQGMWVGILTGLIFSFFLAKNKKYYGEVLLAGMGDKIAIVPVACWIFAGIFAKVLRSSGMVDGILWIAYMTGATETAFIFVTFLACALFATAAGTGFGTIAAGMGVLYPAGVLLGADPYILAGAIVGGGAFGDNLAPISDTTISSAASQDTDVSGVVKSRFKYAAVSGGITLILIVVFSMFYSGSAGSVPAEQIAGKMNAKGLIMFIPALLTIFFAIRTGNIIYALFVGTAVGALLAVVTGLNTLQGIFGVTPGKEGALIAGVAGWMTDLSILVILLVAGIKIMTVGGGSQRLVDSFKGLIKSARGAELSSGILSLVVSALMSINAPAILAVGLSFAKPIGEKFGIHPHRRANIIDAMACTLVYSLPWSAGLLFATGLSDAAAKDFAGVPALSPLHLTPWVMYAWVLMAVMFFAIITGWGRTMMDDKK